MLTKFPTELKHCQSLYDWLMVSAKKTHPTAALSALFTITSAITARGYYTHTKASTSLFIIIIAKSGAGKNIVVQAPDKIMELALQNEKLIISKISSEGAMDDIFKQQYCATQIIDEFGDQLGHMLADKGGYLKVVSAKMKNLYSLTNGMYHSSRYSSSGGKNRTNKPWSIKRPCYGITGISTKTQLLQHLNENMLHDGFLNRFIILSDNEVKPQFNKKPIYDVPDEIVDHIKSIKISKIYTPVEKKDGDSEDINNPALEYFDDDDYKTIMLSEDAEEYFEDYIGDADEIKDSDIYKFCDGDETEINRAVSMRWRENAIRLAVGLVAYEKLETVSLEVLEWCYELVKKSSLDFLQLFTKEASQTQYGELKDKAIEAFQRQGKDKWISLSYLGTSVRPFSTLRAHHRLELLNDLVDTGLFETKTNKLNGKETKLYKLVS